VVVDATTVRLAWIDNSDNESTFYVLRYGQDGALIAIRAVTASPYDVTGLPTGVEACFSVAASLSGVGSSHSTARVCVTPN
jgi:hypothetical protein